MGNTPARRDFHTIAQARKQANVKPCGDIIIVARRIKNNENSQVDLFQQDHATNDSDCTRCKMYKTCQHVSMPGTGPRTAPVMLVGEAPGKKEDAEGVPFVGR